ncbi:MAG: glycosyltransferase family 4 protein [Candidatus Aenigmatarchaeota archaeon]
MKKFFIFLSHPIHYHTSIYKLLAQNKDLDLVVYFYSNFSLGPHIDPQFKTEIDFKKDDILDGYKYIFLKNLSKVKNFKFFDFINYEIPKIIWKEKPDYVLINSWSYFSDWLVVLASLFSRAKLCLRSENPLCHEAKKPKWKIWIKKIILGFLFKQVDIFFYIGKENKEFLKFYGADESKMIFTPYAVDNDYFQKEYEKLKNKKDELRNEMGINNKDIVILFVGKLIPKKRPIDLLLAYEKIFNKKNIKDISLVYVGDGELRKEIEKIIKDKNLYKVFLVGFQNQKNLPKYYIISDIFVLPSDIGETWGLVVNEAMNFGLPIIVSDMVGCGPDLVKSEENGFIFKTGDIEELKNYLLAILNGGKILKFGLKSKEIIKNYTYQRSAENILRII